MLGAGVADLVGFWRHPRRVTRKWRFSRRWPRPNELERLSPLQFEEFLRDIGFDRRITAALTDAPNDGVSTAADRRVRVGVERPG
jgi:hypothetical protein